MNPELAGAIQTLAAERSRLLEQLPCYQGGLEWCQANTDLCDRVARMVFQDAVQQEPEAPPVALIATGGYGRRELAPYSDIDVTLVPVDEGSPVLDGLVRRIYQDLHHAFGTIFRVDVGWAFRLIADAPGLDARTRTGLLDARLIAGSPDVHRRLEEALWESFPVADFVLAKVQERDAMWRKHHDTPLVVEPNLKEGAGGLRSFQAANWIGIAIGERPIKPTVDYDRLVRTRNLLHYVSKRLNDHLTRPRQGELAELLQTRPEELMEPVIRSMIAMHHDYGQGLERLHEARYSLSPGVQALRGEARVLADADAGEASVGIAIATKLGLRIPEHSVLTTEKVVGPAALYAMSTGEQTLRNLDRCGLLDTLLPELTRCRTLLPEDSVHRYTVFEHTLRVVQNLDALEPPSFLGDLKAALRDDSLLYLAALLHDLGKADPSRPHSETGADIATAVCARWGLSARDTDYVAWLVREHLTMARFIQIRDVQNPATIAEFAEIVKDAERLNALTILTWADINAVAPDTWTTAQEAFLRELHARTMDLLQGDSAHAPDPGSYRQRLIRQLSKEEVADEEVTRFVESLPAHYLTSATPEIARLHLRYFRKALEGSPTVEFNPLPELGATEVTVCAQDAPGLLSRMLGVFYALDLSMEGIRASTTRTEKPVALDVFTVSLGGKPVPAATCRQISSALLSVLQGSLSVEALLMEKGKDPFMQQRVFSHTYIAGNPGVLEVRASRGRGMAYRLSRLIAERGWNIVAARVGQWAGSSAAAFYILGTDEQPLTRDQVDSALA
jgi:[protein-PII] uridylyltransferase